jgi:enoyl-CoA hydratase/carnithine racemase
MTADDASVLVDHADHVAVVTVTNAPHNYLNARLVGQLSEALEEIDKDQRFRSTVLQTAGRTFSAGADLSDLDQGLGPQNAGLNPIYHQGLRLFKVSKPIVAAVQGAAVGAGLGLALVADFRVAAPTARFVASFVSLGIHPGFGLTYTLPRIIGHQRADLMFLTGRRIKAEEALVWGLVDQVVAATELRQAALSLATEIAANAPLALTATRATLRRGLTEAVTEHLQIEDAEQKRLRGTQDFAEGVRAVAERRIGRFVGR